MTSSAVFLILAFATFVLAAVADLVPRVKLIPVGLALWVVAEFLGRIH